MIDVVGGEFRVAARKERSVHFVSPCNGSQIFDTSPATAPAAAEETHATRSITFFALLEDQCLEPDRTSSHRLVVCFRIQSPTVFKATGAKVSSIFPYSLGEPVSLV